MHARGILSLPDFIVNAGGVICAAVEYRGGSQAQAFAMIEEKIRLTTQETLERAQSGSAAPHVRPRPRWCWAGSSRRRDTGGAEAARCGSAAGTSPAPVRRDMSEAI